MKKTDRRRSPSDVELEALVRLAGARDLLSHVVAGDVLPQPWTRAAARLIAQAEELLRLLPSAA